MLRLSFSAEVHNAVHTENIYFSLPPTLLCYVVMLAEKKREWISSVSELVWSKRESFLIKVDENCWYKMQGDECLGASKTTLISQLVAGFYLQSKRKHVMWKYIEEPQWVYWKFRNENFLVGCRLLLFMTTRRAIIVLHIGAGKFEASVSIREHLLTSTGFFLLVVSLQDDSQAYNRALNDDKSWAGKCESNTVECRMKSSYFTFLFWHFLVSDFLFLFFFSCSLNIYFLRFSSHQFL